MQGQGLGATAFAVGAPHARERRLSTARVVLAVGALLLLITLVGLPYYTLPIAARVRHPLHPWLKPSGWVGQSAGILAFVTFLSLYLYVLRKKVRWLARIGRLDRWLDVHITLGLLAPLIAAVHAGWRFQGLIGVGYGSMVVVAASGVVGRYLYVHIPRGRAGIELTRAEIDEQRAALVARIARASRVAPAEVEAALAVGLGTETRPGLAATLRALVAADLARWRAVRRLRRRWAGLDRQAARETVRLVRRRIALDQQARLLEATRRLFRFWHVAHRPFAATALVAVAIHVTVAVALGVTWFW